MPEGHTLHRLARDLGGDLAGKKLRISSPQGRFVEATALDGATLHRTFAIGKHLFLDLDRALVHIHCGARSVSESRSLNPELLTFAAWLAKYKSKLPLA